MRVLHLIPSISPLRGGPSQAVLSMVAALRQQGIDASILTSNDHGPGVQPGMPLGRWHQQEALGHFVPVLAFGRWNPPLRVLREFAITPGLSLWLSQNACQYDLVHVHALFSFTTSLGMAQLRRLCIHNFVGWVQPHCQSSPSSSLPSGSFYLDACSPPHSLD